MKKKTHFPGFIVLADDDPDDRLIFKEALNEVDKTVELKEFNGGTALLTYLQNQKNKLPQLIFLDLNMPGVNGFDCLETIRSDERLKNLYVIIYSTSDRFKDILETLNKGANLYFSKPNEIQELSARLKQIFSLNWEEFKPTVSIDKYVMTDGIY